MKSLYVPTNPPWLPTLHTETHNQDLASEVFDVNILDEMWSSLPREWQRSEIRKNDAPQEYADAAIASPAGKRPQGGKWWSTGLSWSDLPPNLRREIAWVLHRRAELGLDIGVTQFRSLFRGLRIMRENGLLAEDTQSLMFVQRMEIEDTIRIVCGGKLRKIEWLVLDPLYLVPKTCYSIATIEENGGSLPSGMPI